MNGLGFQELLAIAALIIMFVRPQELPGIVRKMGKIWARIYYYYTLAKKEFISMEKEIGIEEEMKEIRSINARMKSEIANFDRAFSDTLNTKIPSEEVRTETDEKKE